jgi:hypothetical protein
MKTELKIDFKNQELLENLIQKTYFENGQMGALNGKKNFINISEQSDDVLFTILKGLNDSTIKIQNEDMIDGVARFIVQEEEEQIKLYPISLYCIVDENKKYSFY